MSLSPFWGPGSCLACSCNQMAVSCSYWYLDACRDVLADYLCLLLDKLIVTFSTVDMIVAKFCWVMQLVLTVMFWLPAVSFPTLSLLKCPHSSWESNDHRSKDRKISAVQQSEHNRDGNNTKSVRVDFCFICLLQRCGDLFPHECTHATCNFGFGHLLQCVQNLLISGKSFLNPSLIFSFLRQKSVTSWKHLKRSRSKRRKE